MGNNLHTIKCIKNCYSSSKICWNISSTYPSLISRVSVTVGTNSWIGDHMVLKWLVCTSTEQVFPWISRTFICAYSPRDLIPNFLSGLYSHNVYSHIRTPLLSSTTCWALLLSLATKLITAQIIYLPLYPMSVSFISYCLFQEGFLPTWPINWTPTHTPNPNVKVWGRISSSLPLAKLLAISVYIQLILEHNFTQTFPHTHSVV